MAKPFNVEDYLEPDAKPSSKDSTFNVEDYLEPSGDNSAPKEPSFAEKYIYPAGNSIKGAASAVLSNPTVSHILDPLQGKPGRAMFGGIPDSSANAYGYMPMPGEMGVVLPNQVASQPTLPIKKFSEEAVNTVTNPWNYLGGVGKGVSVLGKGVAGVGEGLGKVGEYFQPMTKAIITSPGKVASTVGNVLSTAGDYVDQIPSKIGGKVVDVAKSKISNILGQDIGSISPLERTFILGPKKFVKEGIESRDATKLTPEEVSQIEKGNIPDYLKPISKKTEDKLREQAHLDAMSNRSFLGKTGDYNPEEVNSSFDKDMSRRLNKSDISNIVVNGNVVPSILKQTPSNAKDLLVESMMKKAQDKLGSLRENIGTAESEPILSTENAALFGLLSGLAHLHPALSAGAIAIKKSVNVIKNIKDPTVALKYYNALDNAGKSEFVNWASKALNTGKNIGKTAATTQTLYNGSAKTDTTSSSPYDLGEKEKPEPIDLGD